MVAPSAPRPTSSSYLVLARKYRPKTFQELVGQEHVTTTLANALEANRLAHAYIFSGPRGCGKTTTARILAKALNCAKGPTPRPCGECPPCLEIASGASPDDVLEIDGASNRGIDQIRELRDTVKYAPARSRHRIIIIDEAHQITDAGFNALLKTLEEPPPHAVFMMATTESQKIPATIVSRCQRFQLKPIPVPDIQAQLKKILLAEKLSVDDGALVEVARAAQGSLRDALSLLDQIIAYAPEGVTGEDIRSLLGLLPRQLVRGFAETLSEGSPEKTLQAVQKAVEDGHDLFQLAQDLLHRHHQLLLWKSGVRSEDVPDPRETEGDAARRTLPELERSLQILSRCAEQMRRSESPRATFELACLDLSQKAVSVDELLDRLEDLERRLGGESAAPRPDPLKKKPEPGPSDGIEPRRADAPARAAFAPPPAPAPRAEQPSSPAVPRPQAAANGAPVSADQVRMAWMKMLETVGKKKPSLEPFLLAARWEAGPGDALRIHCAQEFQKQQISALLPLIAQALESELGRPLSIACALAASAAAAPAPQAREEDLPDEVEDAPSAEEAPEEALPAPPSAAIPAEEIAALDPGLKKVMGRFPGKLKKIETPQ